MRLIVHKTAPSLMLCYVDHHAVAYRWAERRKIERHPQTGAAQLVEVRETVPCAVCEGAADSTSGSFDRPSSRLRGTSAAQDDTRGETASAVIVGMAVLYLAMGILYVFPSRYLWRYASAIQEAVAAPRKSLAVEKALRHQKSFWKFAGIMTLVTMLLYIPGVIAAITIPNLLTAMQRSKQKRTMADVRTIATAVEARAVDTNEYPAASLDELATMLQPKYVQTLPTVDGWGNKFAYQGASCNGRQCTEYVIVSAGKDGKFERSPAEWLRIEAAATTAFNDDIVYANGAFVRYPEGLTGKP